MNCSSQSAANQFYDADPSSNWVNLVQVGSVPFSSSAANATTNVSLLPGDEQDSSVTSLTTDEGLDVSRQPTVLQLTSSGTDLDLDSSDLVNGLNKLHGIISHQRQSKRLRCRHRERKCAENYNK